MKEIESLPQDLYEILADHLPEDFVEFGFYAAYTGEGSYGMSLLAKLESGECENCFANLSANDTFFLFEDLDAVISKARNSIEKDKRWNVLKMHVDSEGGFKIDFEYIDFDTTSRIDHESSWNKYYYGK